MSESVDITKIEDLRGDWNYPTTVHFGVGRIAELADVCKRLQIQKPLFVTDTGLVKLGFVVDMIKSNEAASLRTTVYSQIKPNPKGANIEAGVSAYQQGKCDGVIALGGGSALDAGKAIALMVGQKRPLWDFEDIDDNYLRVNAAGIAPIIAIPTTAGTGSEVGRASVIVDESRQKKVIIFHPKMLPNIVIADAELTQCLPAAITAATGMDAFVHNFEAYCAPGYHPMADGIALEGMRLIKEYLPIAFRHGDNLVARSYMLIASTMGATAFQKGLGAVHALAHPLGALFDAHHGLLNAILLPYVVKQNKPVIEQKLIQIEQRLGLAEHSFVDFFKWMMDFRKDLQIPNDLKTIGISSEKSELIGQLAFQDAAAAGNPVAFTAQQYSTIFENAVNGNLK